MVRPFVRLTFQDQQCRTYTAEGPNPQWNETLMLDVTASPGEELTMDGKLKTDEIRFDLFDEMIVDMVQASVISKPVPLHELWLKVIIV